METQSHPPRPSTSLLAEPLLVKAFRLKSRHYKDHRGLAERVIREHLRKRGYKTWRGQFFDNPSDPAYMCYDRVWLHYEQLKVLLLEHAGSHAYTEFFRYCFRYHGTPDLVAFHPKSKHLLFIEVKFGDEQLRDNQFRCIQHIRHHLRIPVEIHRVVPMSMRIEHRELDANMIELGISHLDMRAVRRHKKVVGGEVSLRKFMRKSVLKE